MTRSSLRRLIARAKARGEVGPNDPVGAAAYVRGYLNARAQRTGRKVTIREAVDIALQIDDDFNPEGEPAFNGSFR